MKAKIIPILVTAILALSIAALAEDGAAKIAGSIAVRGIGTSEQSRDAAKLNEYRDLSDGPSGIFDLNARTGQLFFDAFGENLGRDDMFLTAGGGMYGVFQFNLHADWLTHNFGFGPNGARTPFAALGQHELQLFSTSPAELSKSGTPPWTDFDFATERRNVGGKFEFSGKSPWYFLVDGNNVRQSGINKVDAAALGTSPGNGFIDLPYPVHYSTNNVLVEGGYQSPGAHFALNWLESRFSNDNEFLYFQNPFFGFGMDTATFAPSNNYTRISASGMLRQLPVESTFSARVTYDRNTDDADMIGAVLNTSGSNVLTPTSPTASVFKGKVENVTAQVSLASEPARGLDTRVFYNYYRRHNASTDIAFDVPLTTTGLVCFVAGTSSADSVPAICESERYGYTKNNVGLEAGFRASPGNRLSAGFDYLDINRDRFDSKETGEKKIFIQWSNSSHDDFTARFKYQYTRRRSEFLTNNAGFNADSPYYLERFNRSFDVANLNQHLIKAYFDYSPAEFLDLGFEAYYKNNRYQNLVLGRLSDHRREFYGSVAYGNPEKFRVTLFGDIEFINYDSYHRTVNAGACPPASPGCFDPETAPTATAFNWGADLKDKNWMVELGADWPVKQQLHLTASAIVQRTRGNVDFQSQTLADGTPAALLFPISAYDNTKQWSLNPRAVYVFRNKVELTLGYSFEKYEYNDSQFSGYTYTIGSGPTTSYLTGIYAFPDYKAHIAYSSLRYLF